WWSAASGYGRRHTALAVHRRWRMGDRRAEVAGLLCKDQKLQIVRQQPWSNLGMLFGSPVLATPALMVRCIATTDENKAAVNAASSMVRWRKRRPTRHSKFWWYCETAGVYTVHYRRLAPNSTARVKRRAKCEA